MTLLAFLLKRLTQAALVMFMVSLIGFAVKSELGDPTREMLGESVSEAERAALRDEMGLNDPFFTQYGRFMLGGEIRGDYVPGVLQGNLGRSIFFKRPALDVILDKFPATFELVLASTLIIVLVSVPAGVYCAVHSNSFGARLIMGGSLLGISVPVFLTGIFLMYVFAVLLPDIINALIGWTGYTVGRGFHLPAGGRGETIELPWGWDTGLLSLDGLSRLILPAVALSSIMLPLFIRLIRAEMMETLRTEYVRFAIAKGLPWRRVRKVHAFRNTLLPVVTMGGLQIGTLIAYTILTERVFNWPGMGAMFLEAINRADTPLVIAYIIFVGFVFVVVNTLVDLIYTLINPTVKLSAAA